VRFASLIISVVIALAMEASGSGATGFESEKVAYYQTDQILAERVPNREPLTQYAKKLEQVCARYFAKETTPESLDIVVAVKPGKESRVWFVSSHPGDKVRDSLRKELESVVPCDVMQGPIAFVIVGKIAGGDGKSASPGGGSEPPMPEEWRKADATSERPLIIPDSILSTLWPNK
jgi:hypothetical protein